MTQSYVMLLWHMHQPFYKDLAEDVYTMPWVRLHALKDYFGMVAILEEFPTVDMTFNMVRSLVAQLQDYADDTAREPANDVWQKPPDTLTVPEIRLLLDTAFQVNPNLLQRYPRFRELQEKLRGAHPPSVAARSFGLQDLVDLQVLSQVAWMDEIYLAGDEEIRSLVAKERGYNASDKVVVRKKCLELFNKSLEVYRRAQGRGPSEVFSYSFFYSISSLSCVSAVSVVTHLRR